MARGCAGGAGVMDLPEFLSPPPEKEAMELGLDAVVFDPIEADKEARGPDDGPLAAYLMLDASCSADIPVCAEAFAEPARCLFDGQAFEELGDVGPWLIELRRYGDAWDWFVEEGYGNNWGIVIHARLSLSRLKTHLKKFLKVENEDGEVYFFKYYRPEHFNAYIPVLEYDQRARFMRGIETVFAETHGDPGTLLRHRRGSDGGLITTPQDIQKIGMPLRIEPPSAEDAALWLAKAAEAAD